MDSTAAAPAPKSLLPSFIIPSSTPVKWKVQFQWWRSLVVVLTLAGLAWQKYGSMPSSSPKESSMSFVTRQRDRLTLDGEVFRFVSFNTPDLHVVEDGTWHPITTWEQADALQTVARMGGRVVRIYPMSVVGGLNNGTYTHIQGVRQYNERLFRDLDRLLVQARKYNVRVIIPFIDNWEWWGGVSQFAGLYGRGFTDFYTDAEVVSGFKDLVRFLLERVNTETGVAYKDEPAILAWETGNELDYDDVKEGLPTSAIMDAWTSDLSAFIKSLDPNHLVIDGRLLKNRDVSPSALSDPNTDVISDHFYPNLPHTFQERLEHLLAFTRGRKPFLVGEFGLVMPDTMDSFLGNIQADDAVTGALLWSLRSHNYKGGFYWHYEYDNFWAYHYPGFDSNSVGGERDVMSLMLRYSYSIQHKAVPPLAPPSKPALIQGSTVDAISWRGAVAAQYYSLERQQEDGGGDKWVVVAPRLSDSDNPFVPYADSTAEPGLSYVYRIVAVNDAGSSPPSDPLLIGPTTDVSSPQRSKAKARRSFEGRGGGGGGGR